MASLSELLKKAVAKYGAEAAHSAFGDPSVADKYVSENIVKSTETVTGDTATVMLNASGQGTMTLKKFFTLRLARPPRGVPVIAKKPVVDAFGGTMPDASARAA